MMQQRRGLDFLVGLAVLWLLWRLRADGVLFEVVAVARGDAVANPGALLTGFLIEAVIAIGAVTTLVVSGIWDALFLAGGQAAGALQVFRDYLSRMQPAGDGPPVGDAADGSAGDSGQDAGEPVEQAAAGTVADAIAVLARNVQVVDRNVGRLAERIDAVEQAAKTLPTAKQATEGGADGTP